MERRHTWFCQLYYPAWLERRKDFIAEILKKDIEVFSMLITKKIIETLDAKVLV
jgi:hypothetical protein